MTNESEDDRLADNVMVRETVPNYRMDKNFRPAGWSWVLMLLLAAKRTNGVWKLVNHSTMPIMTL